MVTYNAPHLGLHYFSQGCITIHLYFNGGQNGVFGIIIKGQCKAHKTISLRQLRGKKSIRYQKRRVKQEERRDKRERGKIWERRKKKSKTPKKVLRTKISFIKIRYHNNCVISFLKVWNRYKSWWRNVEHLKSKLFFHFI